MGYTPEHMIELLQGAHIIATIAQKSIPETFWETPGPLVKTPVTAEELAKALETLGETIAACAKHTMIMEYDGEVIDATKDLVCDISGRLLDHTVAEEETPTPLYATIAALWVIDAGFPKVVDYGDDDYRFDRAGNYFKVAMQHCANSNIDLQPVLKNLCGVEKEGWPIFVQLLEDGLVFQDAATAATLV